MVANSRHKSRLRRGRAALGSIVSGVLTFFALADVLTVSPETVWKWIKAGLLPAFKFQGEARIAKADAIAFIEQARL